MKEFAVSVKGLKKSYGKTQALSGISFDVQKGEIVAFLGPNGAGKTTAINILTGLTRQDEGEIYYGGKLFSPENLPSKKIIGVAPQSNNLDRDLTAAENLAVHGILYGIRGKMLKKRIDEALAVVGLTEQRNKPANDLSGGMKRRLVIARALLHEPKALFLDEPSAGLDPVTRRNIHSLIRSLNQQDGVSVFLTTHYIDEAETLSSRVIFIDKGEIVATGGAEELKSVMGRYAVEYIESGAQKIVYFGDRKSALSEAEKHGGNVKVRRVTLEDVYIKLTGKGLE
ncbi:MAG: ABC transporter ATP-binding protein [Deferribacteraceae bacterium]|jgi:ABC-2 type transport system ATP-binding protein|nr:ABC transporter ATP-binding protein [Deferribacteraceae bacterium]